MIKRLFLLLFCLVVFLLSACSNNNQIESYKNASVESIMSSDISTQPTENTIEGPTENADEEITEGVPAINLRNQVFTKVSPFSEGLAWVQYADADGTVATSVINTDGKLMFTVDRKVDYYSPFVDGFAFYLYTVDPSAGSTLDNVASCIVDREGNVTYSSEDDGVRIILGHGDGHFLAIEHISNFDADEWRFGSINQNGDILIDFDIYNYEPFFFWNSDDYGYFITVNGDFLSNCSYLGEGIFDICSHNGHYVLYDVRKRNVIYSSSYGRPVIKDGFCDGTMVYGYWGNSYSILKIDSSGNEVLLDRRSPFDKSKVFLSAYSEGLFFYDHAYYDLELNVKIDLSKYNDKMIGGGPFKDGYAPLYICGADGKDYFTILDSQGNELFTPILGSPAQSFSGGYLAVQTDSGCILFNTQGEQVLQCPYSILGNISLPHNSYSIWDITGTVSKVVDGFFVVCKENDSVPTIFVGIDGSYIGQ